MAPAVELSRRPAPASHVASATWEAARSAQATSSLARPPAPMVPRRNQEKLAAAKRIMLDASALLATLTAPEALMRRETVSSIGKPVDNLHRNLTAITSLVLRMPAREPDQTDELLKTMRDAIAFSGALPSDVPPPSITASEDGEIAFQWLHGTQRAIVNFEGDGSYGYALLVADKFVPGGTEVTSASATPDDMIAYLRSMR